MTRMYHEYWIDSDVFVRMLVAVASQSEELEASENFIDACALA